MSSSYSIVSIINHLSSIRRLNRTNQLHSLLLVHQTHPFYSNRRRALSSDTRSTESTDSKTSTNSTGSSDSNPTTTATTTTEEKKRLNLQSSPYLTSIRDQLRLIKKRLSHEVNDLSTRLSQLTGYTQIDQLKSLVAQKQSQLNASRLAASEAKNLFKQAAHRRAESLREVNDLLARKAGWSDHDLARFTTLVKTDHSNEQIESQAKQKLEESEARVDHQFTEMMQAILTRYHEEQVWSDKIRALSTTFSLSITLINVLVFLAAIVVIEPYKRSKVVSGVEERITVRDLKNSEILDRALNLVADRLASTENQLSELVLALQPLSSSSPSNASAEEAQDQYPSLASAKTMNDQGPPAGELGPEPNRLAAHLGDQIEPEANETLPITNEEAQELPKPSSSSHPSDPPSSSPDWKEKTSHLVEPDLYKVLGIGAMVGIILLSSFDFFSSR